MNRVSLASALVLLATSLASQNPTITILETAQAGSATIRTFDELAPQAGSTSFLTGVEILPIDKTQRTQISDLDFERSRRVERQGLTWIETPAGAKVLHYRRAAASAWGYLLILPSGEPIVLDERSSFGPNPYGEFVGVAGDGMHAAFTTGPNLIVARLDGTNFTSTNAPSRELPLPAGAQIEVPSLSPGATHTFFVTDDERIWRCAHADGSSVEDITPTTTDVAAEPDDELAMSRDGSKIAFLFGPRDLESLWVVDGTTAARKLAAPPAKYEDVGYLPETIDGPRMLMNDDGSKLMYIDATIRDEGYVIDTDTDAIVQFTSDAHFQPYIGVTIIPSFHVSSLLVAVGDLQRMDWFDVAHGTDTVSNVSQTGAGTTPPFATGVLEPLAGSRFQDGSMLAFEAQWLGPTRLEALHPASGTLWSMPRTLRDTPRIGASLGGTPRLRMATNEGDLLFDAASAQPTMIAPPGIELSTEIVHSTDSFSLLVAEIPATGASALILRTPTQMITLSTLSGIEQVALTDHNGVVLDTGVLRYVGPAGDVVLGQGGTTGVVLSGASN